MDLEQQRQDLGNQGCERRDSFFGNGVSLLVNRHELPIDLNFIESDPENLFGERQDSPRVCINAVLFHPHIARNRLRPMNQK